MHINVSVFGNGPLSPFIAHPSILFFCSSSVRQCWISEACDQGVGPGKACDQGEGLACMQFWNRSVVDACVLAVQMFGILCVDPKVKTA